MIKRIFVALVALGIVCGGAFLWYARYPAIAPITPPSAAQFTPAQIARGSNVAAQGYCVECHTRKDIGGGPELAGDYAMHSPFGTIYSSNITPDIKTGIGTWSEAAFSRALRQGIGQKGEQLLPAFVYDHFTKMNDQDIADLYSWIMTRPAVSMSARPNGGMLAFTPRIAMAGWKLIFFRPGRYQPNSAQDAQWNRGAYLAEGASHCGACHTPRNILGAEELSHAYDGNVVDGWMAPPLNTNNPTPVSWTEDELYHYLRYGVAPLHGPAGGPMSPVAHDYMANIASSDVRAIAHYFAAAAHAPDRASADQHAIAQAMQASGGDLTSAQSDPDARLYQGACAACHYNAGIKPVLGRPELALNNALWLSEPTNLYLVMLGGLSAPEGQSGIAMPSFYVALNDHDMARIAAYLRRTRTSLPPWSDLEKKAAAARAIIGAPPVNASH